LSCESTSFRLSQAYKKPYKNLASATPSLHIIVPGFNNSQYCHRSLTHTMAPLSGKVAIVTGASKGIGKAVVERLAADGASVVINYNSDAASANAVVKAIGADRALAVQADVSKVAEIQKLVDATVEKFGKIDILMPNAGLMKLKPLEAVTEADYDSHFNLNVKGPMFLVQVSPPALGPPVMSATDAAHRGLYRTWLPAAASSSCPRA